MEGPGELYLPGESPYSDDHDHYESGITPRCRRCGSYQTTSYVRLMVAANPGKAISGDLIFHPVEVVTCLMCNKTSYRNFQTLRDS